jgi:oligopeptide transport system substrate-binding protein
MQVGFRLRAIALASAGLFVVAACGTSSGSGVTLASAQELRIRLTTEPATFDPGQAQWDYEGAVTRQTFESLLSPSKDFKDVTPAAAESYSVDSTGLIWTFKLRPGAKWSDGVAVKAADFVYGYQRILDPRLAAPYASFFYTIKGGAAVNAMDPKDPTIDAALLNLGLKAVDDNTFQITLEAPAGYFKWEASLVLGGPVRKDIVQKFGKDSSGTDKWAAVAATAPQSVVGNGPYKISEVVPKDHVTLVPNTNYVGTRSHPTLTKITEYYIDDETVAYAKYKSGELDMVPVPLADTEAARNSPELLKIPQLVIFWVNMNTKKPPFDNPKVRLAITQAIDRDSYVKNIQKGRAIAASTLIPKGMRNYRPDLGTQQSFNAATAKATLASSGVAASALNGVKYMYRSSSPGSKTAAEFFQAQLKTNLGIDVVLDGTDSKTESARFKAGNYQFGDISGWGADYPDSQDWFDIFVSGSGNNFSFWSNKAYDDATAAGDAATDNAKRDTAYETASKLLVGEAPVMFLYQPTAWYLVKPYVKGINSTPNDDQWLGDYFANTIQIAQH